DTGCDSRYSSYCWPNVRREYGAALLTAGVSVVTRYATMTVGAVRLAHASARPIPITAEPTYRGWATHRYGPDVVTSRDLFRCPAAQMRMPSPIAAIPKPIASDRAVGCASARTSAPNTNPSVTRRRASA